ncbi:MAG: ABC transporter ATP-binding protein [Sporolactobacillus sp.]
MNMRKYLFQNKKLNGVIIALDMLTTLAQTLAAFVLTFMMDGLIHASIRSFFFWLSINTLLWILLIIADYFFSYLKAISIQRMDTQIRNDLAIGITNLSYDRFHHLSINNYSSWFNNDIVLINEQGFESFFSIITYGSSAIFASLLLIVYNWWLFALVLLLAVLMNVVPKWTSKKTDQRSKERTAMNELFVNKLQNFIEGMDTLINFHRSNELIKNIRHHSLELNKTNVAYEKQKAFVSFISFNASSLSQLCVLLFTGVLVLMHWITPGSIISTGNLAGLIFTSLSQLTSLVVVVKSVQPIFDKYKGLATEQHSDIAFDSTVHPSLKLNDVSVGDGEHTWLLPNSFQIKFNDKLYLTGPSGSGKSTLMRIIAGLTEHYQGGIDWDPPLSDHANQNRYVLYVQQTPFIFNETLRYNLTLGAQVTDEQLSEALEVVDLKHTVDKLANGLDTVLSNTGADLSGGERQRLALARALLVHAPVLILDESTSNVDPDTASKIESYFLTMDDRTVIFISHNPHPEIEHLFTARHQVQ